MEKFINKTDMINNAWTAKIERKNAKAHARNIVAASKFEVGQAVKTSRGLTGEVVGVSHMVHIMIDGKVRKFDPYFVRAV